MRCWSTRRIRGCRPDQAILSVKFGVLRDPDGGLNGFDNRPAALRNFIGGFSGRVGIIRNMRR
jgi:hypothetical protein